MTRRKPRSSYDSWGPLWLAGGINKRHPDGRDLERATRFATGIARKVWDEPAEVRRG